MIDCFGTKAHCSERCAHKVRCFFNNFTLPAGSCIAQPQKCTNGLSVVMRAKIMSPSATDNTTVRFLFDSGGFNGEGVSLYTKGEDIVSEVADKSKFWRVCWSFFFTFKLLGKVFVKISTLTLKRRYRQAYKSTDKILALIPDLNVAAIEMLYLCSEERILISVL